MQPRSNLIAALASPGLALMTLQCVPDTSTEVSGPGIISRDGDEEQGADGEEILFESITVQDENGEVLSKSVSGALDIDTFQKSTSMSLNREDPYIYSKDVWSVASGDGTSETVYRVKRRANPDAGIATVAPEPTPPIISDALAAALGDDDPSSIIEIMVRFSHYPEWDIPVRPDETLQSPDDVKATYQIRKEALSARKALLAGRASSELPEAVSGLRLGRSAG